MIQDPSDGSNQPHPGPSEHFGIPVYPCRGRAQFGGEIRDCGACVQRARRRIVKGVLPRPVADAQKLCSRQKALPFDWELWFPHCVYIRLNLDRAQPLRAAHLVRYATVRPLDHDEARYLEAAQCWALLFYLGNPDPEAIVAFPLAEGV